MADYLLNPQAGQFVVDATKAREALLQAIQSLAPHQNHDTTDPLHQYAFSREAELQWELGQKETAIKTLEDRESPIPRENLARWQSWYEDIRTRVDPNDPSILTTRNNIAFQTGNTGNAQRALELFVAVLPDQERVLGKDHPDTKNTVAWIESLRSKLSS